MNVIEDIKEKNEKRWLFLNKLYELSGGSTEDIPTSKIVEELEFDKEVVRHILGYLKGEKLIKVRTLKDEIIAIEDIRKVEEFLSNP